MHKAVLTLSLLLVLGHTARAQNENDTFKLYFDLNVATLNKAAQHTIDLLIYNDKIMPNSALTIVGYADYLGTEGYNQALSEQRAENIAGYLGQYGISKKNIKHCIGRGEVERKGLSGKEGYPTDRRVDIVVNGTGNQHAGPHKVMPSMDLSTYQSGQTFVLKKIYFFPESHRVKPESMPVLQTLYNTMIENPKLKIRIEGHVCCIIDYPDAVDMDSHDSHLSVNRAKSIYDYLVEKGISKSRLQYAGYGKSRPIVAHERTEEDADKNRRVEIRILEK